MTHKLASKVPLCVVTGFSRGLGKKCYETLASTNRFHMIGISRTQGHKCDLSNPDEIKSLVESLRKEYNDHLLQYVIHCSGVHHDGLLMRQTDEAILQQFQTNLVGTSVFAREILKWMMRQRASAFVDEEQQQGMNQMPPDRSFTMLSSIVGLDGNTGQSIYSASKAGMLGLTKSLAKEVGSRGIRVNSVAPGWIGGEGMAQKWSEKNEEKKKALLKTIPLQREGEPEDVAKLVRFLSSEDAKYITGQTIRVDGGLQI